MSQAPFILVSKCGGGCGCEMAWCWYVLVMVVAVAVRVVEISDVGFEVDLQTSVLNTKGCWRAGDT